MGIDMYRILRKLLTSSVFHVEHWASFWRALRSGEPYWYLGEGLPVSHGPRTLDADTLMVVVRQAWVDNGPKRRFFAYAMARLHFNEAVSRYVVRYFKLTGQLPVGNHYVRAESEVTTYFGKFHADSPRSTLGSERIARSNAS